MQVQNVKIKKGTAILIRNKEFFRPASWAFEALVKGLRTTERHKDDSKRGFEKLMSPLDNFLPMSTLPDNSDI
jgi:hypothetical protein